MGINSSLALLKFLYAQRVKGFTSPLEPLLDPEALIEYKRLLSLSRSYLEFGSGGSTMLAAKLGKPTLSVECDRFYARTVRQAIGVGKPIEIIDVSIGFTREWGFPVFTAPTPRRLKRWKRYSEAPFAKIADRGVFPDFVLVDGRFRRACALRTAAAAAAAGQPVTIMIDDYLDRRDHYQRIEKFLGAPRKAGRAGVFEIGPEGPSRLPADADLDEAAADFW